MILIAPRGLEIGISISPQSAPEAHGQTLRNATPFKMGFPSGSVVKKLLAPAGEAGSIPELGRSPGEGNGNPLQHSYLRNPMDKGAWWAAVHAVAKSLLLSC